MAKQNRRFTPPEADTVPAIVSEAEQWEEKPVLTLGGKPIPPDIAHLVPYANTDQGIAERAAKRTHEPSGITMGRGPEEKKLDRMVDFDQYDPLRELKEQHGEAGFVNRMLSPRVIAKKGMRGWEPVKGEDGQPVKHGDLILGRMPAEVKRRRDQRLEALNREQQEQFAEQQTEEMNRIVRDSGVKGIAALRSGDHLDAWDSEAQADIGLSRSRGSDLAA